MIAGGLRSAEGANSNSFTDPLNDFVGGSPDITGVTISNNDSGVVTVAMQFAAGRPLVSGMNAGVYFDTDFNQGTGSSTGSEYRIVLDVGPGTFLYSRWNGSDWEVVDSGGKVQVSYGSASVTFTINRAELGGTTKLNFWTFGNWTATEDNYDFAPDGDAVWAYDVIVPTTTTTTTPVVNPPPTTTTPAPTTTNTVTTAGVDTDKDGVLDTADKCPKARAGSWDKNKNGCPGPFSAIRVPTGDDLRPTKSSGGITSYESPRNTIRNLPAGTKVLLRFGSQRELLLAGRSGSVKSKLLLRNQFRHNSKVEIWAWKPGWIGFGIRLVVRTSAPFASVVNRRCIAATASTPRPCRQVSRGG